LGCAAQSYKPEMKWQSTECHPSEEGIDVVTVFFETLVFSEILSFVYRNLLFYPYIAQKDEAAFVSFKFPFS
jgi:hypothetical protein